MAVLKRGLDLFLSSLIELGQALLKLDGVGFDAMRARESESATHAHITKDTMTVYIVTREKVDLDPGEEIKFDGDIELADAQA